MPHLDRRWSKTAGGGRSLGDWRLVMSIVINFKSSLRQIPTAYLTEEISYVQDINAHCVA